MRNFQGPFLAPNGATKEGLGLILGSLKKSKKSQHKKAAA